MPWGHGYLDFASQSGISSEGETMPLNLENLRTTMFNYLHKFKRMQAIVHQLGDGLQIRTQPANQTSKEGKAKFTFGLETVWLSIKHPNKPPINLVRLSEQPYNKTEFEVLLLGEYEDLVLKHLDKLVEIATP
jgi:hypothetical protein